MNGKIHVTRPPRPLASPPAIATDASKTSFGHASDVVARSVGVDPGTTPRVHERARHVHLEVQILPVERVRDELERDAVEGDFGRRPQSAGVLRDVAVPGEDRGEHEAVARRSRAPRRTTRARCAGRSTAAAVSSRRRVLGDVAASREVTAVGGARADDDVVAVVVVETRGAEEETEERPAETAGVSADAVTTPAAARTSARRGTEAWRFIEACGMVRGRGEERRRGRRKCARAGILARPRERKKNAFFFSAARKIPSR